ncbi:response regulator transcription factor [Kitasatospora sp. NPDC056184]|uniref:response regulator transcription factor n=1 Tax=Kitasatospora sp. NPDC056184 TaxID=3345738 RepID=UPI0035DB977D
MRREPFSGSAIGVAPQPSVVRVLTDSLLAELPCVIRLPSHAPRGARRIAARLFIGPATVKTHVARLLTKLDARDRVHLVIAAYAAGLVSASG